MFKLLPRAELALIEPLSDDRSVVCAESYCLVVSARVEAERAVSVPEGRVVSTTLFSAGVLVASVPPGWNVLATGICCDWNGLPTG